MDTAKAKSLPLTVVPHAVSLGAVAVGDSTWATVRLHGTPDFPTIVSSMKTGTPFFTVGRRTPLVIAPNGATDVTVFFTPRRFGNFTDTLTIHSDAGSEKVVLHGKSPFPSLAADRDSLDFGLTARDSASTQSVVLNNPSINTLDIDSIYTRSHRFRPLAVQAGIPGGGSLILTVEFLPDSAGAFADTLTMHSNGLEHELDVALAGSCPPPLLEVPVTIIRFGEVAIGDSLVERVGVSNASITALALSGATIRNPGFRTRGIMPMPVLATDTLSLPIMFRPRRFGDYSDTLVITSDGGTARVALEGKSPYPILVPSVDALNFGAVRKGTPARKQVVIRNLSINTLAVDSVYTRSSRFAPGIRRGTVRAVDSLVIETAFVPDRFRSFSDTLVIVSNSLNRHVEIPLSGYSPAPVLAVAARALAFGSVALGDTSTAEFTLYNRSTLNDLSIGEFLRKKAYFLVGPRAPVTIKCGDSATVRVRFTVGESAPNGYGIHNDTLRIESDGGTASVAMKGESPHPSVAASLDDLDFGNVEKKQSATLPLWLTNTSLNTLRIDSLVLRNRKIFGFKSIQAPLKIRRGGGQNVELVFMPDSTIFYTDTLYVYSNAPGLPLTVPVTGHGISLRGVESEWGSIPSTFCLYKNYPNPFNLTTTIKYGLPRPSTISLAVYNTLGQRVADLFEGYQEAGYHTIMFNATGLSSGVYFCRFQADDFVDTKKLVLLR